MYCGLIRWRSLRKVLGERGVRPVGSRREAGKYSAMRRGMPDRRTLSAPILLAAETPPTPRLRAGCAGWRWLRGNPFGAPGPEVYSKVGQALGGHGG